ncbi:MAG: sugar ABC transporter substrate-binding protein, partial [Paenibacillus sp.]|nr:sugar ABC transporter substrate-binding protein [Paenibacillus sp.]
EVVLDKGIPAHANYLLTGRDIGIAPGSPQTYYAQIPGLSNEVEDLYDLMLLGKASSEETIENISSIVKKKTEEAK